MFHIQHINQHYAIHRNRSVSIFHLIETTLVYIIARKTGHVDLCFCQTFLWLCKLQVVQYKGVACPVGTYHIKQHFSTRVPLPSLITVNHLECMPICNVSTRCERLLSQPLLIAFGPSSPTVLSRATPRQRPGESRKIHFNWGYLIVNAEIFTKYFQ